MRTNVDIPGQWLVEETEKGIQKGAQTDGKELPKRYFMFRRPIEKTLFFLRKAKSLFLQAETKIKDAYGLSTSICGESLTVMLMAAIDEMWLIRLNSAVSPEEYASIIPFFYISK
jgi:hypothetical protein